jgi:hypothetical protein
MTKWLLVGGVAALAYLIVTTAHAATPAPGQPSRPLPSAPPVQQPLPPASPQTTIVPGASSGILQDAQAAAGIVGTLADAARKFGLFGGDEPSSADTTGISFDPTSGASFF